MSELAHIDAALVGPHCRAATDAEHRVPTAAALNRREHSVPTKSTGLAAGRRFD